MPKTVWILGAGFARSLGAPLLSDLFRQEGPRDAEAYFPNDSFPGLVRDIMAAQIAFNWGRTVEHLWEDAEQFLVFLDDAIADGAPQKKARLAELTSQALRKIPGLVGYHARDGIWHETMRSDLHRASRRALAAETSRFMMTARDGELWLPYRKWAGRLDPVNDTIITFNYDVLLDELGKQAPLSIPLPHEESERGKVPVLKLHGSTNWVAEGASHKKLRDYEVLAYPSGLWPAIAAPGRSKSPQGEPPFPRLWSMAETAISEAERVFFVGYRFPPTDALARLRFSEALAKSGGPFRQIHTVLGPDVESHDSRRLLTLLVAARGNRQVEGDKDRMSGAGYLRLLRLPLWAEDFLTTYEDVTRR